MNIDLLRDLRAALPPGADLGELLAEYCGEHPRDREALALLLDAATEKTHNEPAR